ncbi:unnamed protein product [Darwinula stevensoni]|uniref:Uncharacterized protein n=1 Tax=Darwinula stevensoni TaxID=69355 RepID=A0A7R8XDC6_9CRUS|nr:unnamed protein product [Darwinula stevensoni]CAG0894585.1 unnamed protein product [Darwinula stevensoni]
MRTGIFKDRNILIDMNLFLDNLAEKDLISKAEEMNLREQEYSKKIDDVFLILFQRNPKPTLKRVLKILKKMDRQDIIAKLKEAFGGGRGWMCARIYVYSIISRMALIEAAPPTSCSKA